MIRFRGTFTVAFFVLVLPCMCECDLLLLQMLLRGATLLACAIYCKCWRSSASVLRCILIFYGFKTAQSYLIHMV